MERSEAVCSLDLMLYDKVEADEGWNNIERRARAGVLGRREVGAAGVERDVGVNRLCLRVACTDVDVDSGLRSRGCLVSLQRALSACEPRTRSKSRRIRDRVVMCVLSGTAIRMNVTCVGMSVRRLIKGVSVSNVDDRMGVRRKIPNGNRNSRNCR